MNQTIGTLRGSALELEKSSLKAIVKWGSDLQEYCDGSKQTIAKACELIADAKTSALSKNTLQQYHGVYKLYLDVGDSIYRLGSFRRVQTIKGTLSAVESTADRIKVIERFSKGEDKKAIRADYGLRVDKLDPNAIQAEVLEAINATDQQRELLKEANKGRYTLQACQAIARKFVGDGSHVLLLECIKKAIEARDAQIEANKREETPPANTPETHIPGKSGAQVHQLPQGKQGASVSDTAPRKAANA